MLLSMNKFGLIYRSIYSNAVGSLNVSSFGKLGRLISINWYLLEFNSSINKVKNSQSYALVAAVVEYAD